MSVDIENLKALALAANREVWTSDDIERDGTVYGEDGDSVCVCHSNIGASPDPIFAIDRAAFISTANPAAVLELIAEVESIRSAPAAGTVKDSVQVTPEMIQAMKFADMAADYTGLGITEQQRYTAIFNAAIEAHNRAGKEQG